MKLDIYTHSVMRRLYSDITIAMHILNTVLFLLFLGVKLTGANKRQQVKEAGTDTWSANIKPEDQPKQFDKIRKKSDKFFAPFIIWSKMSNAVGCALSAQTPEEADAAGLCVSRY